MSAEVATGALGNKSSSAVYSIQIVKTPLALFTDVIGIITSQKTAELGNIVWQCGDMYAANLRLLETALTRARAKAQLAARILGVDLTGVRTFTESFRGDETTAQRSPAPVFGAAIQRSRVDAEELGLEVTHRKSISANIAVEFRVSAIKAAS